MIVPAGVKVHLALGYTDMRRGLDGYKRPWSVFAAGHPACALANGMVKLNAAPRCRFSAQMAPP